MYVKLSLVLILFGTIGSTNRVSYDGYQVYEVTPLHEQHISQLDELKKNPNYDFWGRTRQVGKPSSIMVKPDLKESFISLMKDSEFKYDLLIENLERTFEAERLRQSKFKSTRAITFDAYYRYDEINAYLENLTSVYDFLTLYDAGQSTEGRTLRFLRISTGGNGTKPAILMEGGNHAREWISPAVVLYIIQELVENSFYRVLIENLDWYILPVLNPDGYEYSFDVDRLWRKTRSVGTECVGVDNNRNFGFHWMEEGASDYECDEDYAGPEAFSEPESLLFANFVYPLRDQIKFYISFHSYGPIILYPWSYTSDYLPDNADELQRVGDLINANITRVSTRGTTYTVGASTQVLYPAAGCSDDWVKGAAEIPFSYCIELPGGGNYGFDMPADQILGIVGETFVGVRTAADYVIQTYGRERKGLL